MKKVVPAWSEVLYAKKQKRRKSTLKYLIYSSTLLFVFIAYGLPIIGKEIQISKIKLDKNNLQSREDIRVYVGDFRSNKLAVEIKQTPHTDQNQTDDRDQKQKSQKPFEIPYEIIDEYLVAKVPRKTKPGKYTLYLIEGERILYTEDYTWGLLVLNTTKPRYKVGDAADVQMAVLDDFGEMVCDAKVTLNVTDPFGEQVSYSTVAGQIKVNPECFSKELTLTPDYELTIPKLVKGTYMLVLDADDGKNNNSINDSFEVTEELDFDVERTTATRIYPLNIIPVTISVQANQDFNGKIVEKVPLDFELQPPKVAQSFSEIVTTPIEKLLVWETTIKKGETIKLGYYYDAPDVSPFLFTLGELEFYKKTQIITGSLDSGQEQTPDLFIVDPSQLDQASKSNSSANSFDQDKQDISIKDPANSLDLIDKITTLDGVKTSTDSTNLFLSETVSSTEATQTTQSLASKFIGNLLPSLSDEEEIERKVLQTIKTSQVDDSEKAKTTGEIIKSEDLVYKEPRKWQIASDSTHNMILFWDNGSSIPSGWSCISCTSGDDFYQRFVRGAATYGSTGGSATHTHTATSSVSQLSSGSTESGNGSVSNYLHTHSYTPTISSVTNLPSYRQLRIIRYDTVGEPATLPAGAIAMFDSSVPSGWTRYSSQDTYYIRGETTIGTTGGTNNDSHTISGSTGAASTANETRIRGGGTQVSAASSGHTHTVSGATVSIDKQPPYIEVVLGKLDSAAAPINGMIAMWDATPDSTWIVNSVVGGAFYNNFVKGASSYGTTGGAATHTPANLNITTGTGVSTNTRSGSAGADGAHTHTVSLTNFSSGSSLPPYRDAIFAKRNDVFTISGICKQLDQSTNCTDSQTVRVAYNGTLQSDTTTTSSGTWSITPTTPPNSGDIVTVFLDNVANSNEAVTITKYDGTGPISGIYLFEDTLSLGSADNPTLSNADIDAYDNSVSGDEDIFFDIDSNNDLVVDSLGQSSTEKLVVKAGTTYQPDSTSSGNVTTHDIEISGTLTADGNTINVSGSWANFGSFNANTSTVVMTATTGTETIDSTGATTAGFNNLTLGQSSGTATWNLQSDLDVNKDLTIDYGTLAMNGTNNINLAEDLLINATGSYSSGTGKLIFDGSTTATWTDNNTTKESMGTVEINGTSKTVNLASSVEATEVNIYTSQTLGLASSGYTLTLTGSGTGSSRPFIIAGTLNEGTDSTVAFLGTSATEIEADTYNNLTLAPDNTGSPTFTLATGASQSITVQVTLTVGDGSNAVTVTAETNDPTLDVNGDFVISSSTTFSASSTSSFTIAGDYTNNGTFNEGTGTVTFDGTTSTVLDSGCSDATSCTNENFYNLTVNKTSTDTANDNVTLSVTDLRVTNTITITDGEFIQGALNVQAEGTTSISVQSNGAWTNISTGDITLGGDVSNAGVITLQGNGQTCGDNDDILIRPVDNKTKNWTGSGTFDFNDIDVRRMGGTATINAYSSTDSGQISGGWNILTNCGNTAPDAPTSLTQVETDDTAIATGDWISATSIKFTASATDTDNPDTLELCVEAQPIGTAFTGTETLCGTGVAYSGTAVTVSVTITTLSNDEEYHWQARIRDASSEYSSWVSFGGNAESARDFGLDSTAPTGGTVYDGVSAGVDSDYSTSSLSQLSANWSGFSSGASGLSEYEYSIGTTQGATDVLTWTSAGTATSVTATSLSLQTSQAYYFNVRAVDNAGNVQTGVSSDGQIITPSLTFSVTPATLAFNNLNSGNGYTDSQTVTLTTSTNAYNGYIVRAYTTDLLRSTDTLTTIPNFDGGTYASPDEWLSGDRGFGYTSSDSTIQGSNKFGGTPCAGGGNPPCYAPFSQSAPGDIVADNTSNVSGTPISNEQFTITYKVQTDAVQGSANYTTTVVYTITAIY